MELLPRFGLALPAEAQWEHAARAGATTPWWTGIAMESLEGAANLADLSFEWLFEEVRQVEDWLDDGHGIHAPVGTYRANAFGLHDVAGNAWEWCRDEVAIVAQPEAVGDTHRIARGGAYDVSALGVRSAYRAICPPDSAGDSRRVRPAMAIDR